MATTIASFPFLTFLVIFFSLSSFSTGQTIQSEETLLPLTPEEEYTLKPDEEWPQEVAHLFENEEEKKARKDPTAQKQKRTKRWTEWVSEKHEFREDSWDEPSDKILKKPPDEPKYIAFMKNDTYVMSRCASNSAALTLVIACPQPRGSNFHRIVNLKTAVYGWSQMEGKICQYVEGDCTLRYEFVHKQMMKPTTPQNEEEFRTVGPQYFCNPWDGGGRENWEMPSKRWCSIGLKRKSQTPKIGDPLVNVHGAKYLYTWGTCGSSYDWFDYLHIQYTCEDVMEPIGPDATRPYHYRPKPDCSKTTKAPAGNATTSPQETPEQN